MLPRAPSESAHSPPEELLIRRVVSERDALEQLRSSILSLRNEPTTWLAPSHGAYLERLEALGEELSRGISASGALALELELDHAQVRHLFVVGA